MTKYELWNELIFFLLQDTFKGKMLLKLDFNCAEYSPAGSTLHTAHYPLHTAPAHEHAHVPAPV